MSHLLNTIVNELKNDDFIPMKNHSKFPEIFQQCRFYTSGDGTISLRDDSGLGKLSIFNENYLIANVNKYTCAITIKPFNKKYFNYENAYFKFCKLPLEFYLDKIIDIVLLVLNNHCVNNPNNLNNSNNLINSVEQDQIENSKSKQIYDYIRIYFNANTKNIHINLMKSTCVNFHPTIISNIVSDINEFKLILAERIAQFDEFTILCKI